MGKLPNKLKQNPKLIQWEMSDGRASLWLEYNLGRSESPVYGDDGNHVIYESGAMKGKRSYILTWISGWTSGGISGVLFLTVAQFS